MYVHSVNSDEAEQSHLDRNIRNIMLQRQMQITKYNYCDQLEIQRWGDLIADINHPEFHQ